MIVKNIFHIHDTCNGHSLNTVEKVFEVANQNKSKNIYFTEHVPLGSESLYRPSYNDIKNLKKRITALNKNYPEIKAYFGYEMEYPKYGRFFFNQCVRDKYCDFLIFGNHHYNNMWSKEVEFSARDTKTLKQLKEYRQNAYDAIHSGLFSWMAHPDIFLKSWGKWDKHAVALCSDIIEWCLKCDLPVGFNINYNEKTKKEFDYPCKHFWELVSKTRLKVIIEADSHSPETLTKEWHEKNYKLALSWGLKSNLVDEIDIKWINKKPEALVFDLDGVITETSEYHYMAWRDTVRKYDMDITFEQNEMIKGLPREETLSKICEFNKKSLNKSEFEKVCKNKNDYYLNLINKINPSAINPNITKLLKDAKKRQLKIALASSSRNAMTILDGLGLKEYFDYIVDPAKIKNGKPSPDIYLAAAKGLGVKPWQCIGFEDADIGISGLNDAQMFSLGISNTNKYVKDESNYHVYYTKQLKLKKIIKEFNNEAKYK